VQRRVRRVDQGDFDQFQDPLVYTPGTTSGLTVAQTDHGSYHHTHPDPDRGGAQPDRYRARVSRLRRAGVSVRRRQAPVFNVDHP